MKALKRFFYYKINKPYGVLSQFTDKLGRITLSGIYNFEPDVYPIGRLDMDSEGLLLLTNYRGLADRLLNPKYLHEREYHVQVEGEPTDEALNRLCKGVLIEGKKTLPAVVKLLKNGVTYPDRIPPIRERKNIPTSWLSITLKEGRNRQVRKMTASVGYPTLRLIRVRIANILLDDIKPGEVKKLSDREIKNLLLFLKVKSF